MTKNFLITRPTHDVITSYLHDFSKEIVKTIKESKDIHITDLEGSNATRTKFRKIINKRNAKN